MWRRSAGWGLLSLYLLFLAEWLFYITKPSFFSVLSPLQSVSVLWIAPLPFAALVIGFVGVVRLTQAARLSARVAALLYAAIPACALTGTFILLIDNFTYTVFELGVVTARNALRLLYGVFFLALFAGVVHRLARRLAAPEGPPARALLASAGGLVSVSILCVLAALVSRASSYQANAAAGAPAAGRPPDIFLISGDAFEVDDFERYGEPIEDATFFRALGPHTVVFENSFPNANRTASSTALVLTGKYATTTRKYNGARFFSGRDRYQHLPGLLRSHGYRSIQIGAGHHVDSFYWGMRNAFDVHNHTTVDRSLLVRLSDALGGRLDWEFHFSQVVTDRIGERLRHAFGGQLMEQPHLIARQKLDEIDDQVMVEQLLDFLHQHPGPVFAQLHSMSTRHWRAGTDAGRRGRLLDEYVGLIVQDLQRTGRFQNSIIVIWSDHGRHYTKDRRLPLIMKFPRPVSTPGRSWNTQALDIAPTILDYLGIPVPSWMEGRSLLREIDRYEPIFSIGSHWDRPGIDPGSVGTMVKGGVKNLGLIVCNKSWNVRFPGGSMSWHWIDGHTSPCDPSELPSNREAASMMVQHLVERGYGRAIGVGDLRATAQ